MDFYHKSPIGEPWIISHPAKNGSHLDTYSHTTRKAGNKAPVLGEFEVNVETPTTAGTPVSVTFAAGKDDEFVHDYIITVSQADGTPMYRKKILADFYVAPQASQMKASWTRPIGTFNPGAYKVTLLARDSWGAQSETLEREFTIE